MYSQIQQVPEGADPIWSRSGCRLRRGLSRAAVL